MNKQLLAVEMTDIQITNSHLTYIMYDIVSMPFIFIVYFSGDCNMVKTTNYGQTSPYSSGREYWYNTFGVGK